jgi:hypothetical protein
LRLVTVILIGNLLGDLRRVERLHARPGAEFAAVPGSSISPACSTNTRSESSAYRFFPGKARLVEGGDRRLPGRGRRSLIMASVTAAGEASITLRSSGCVR